MSSPPLLPLDVTQLYLGHAKRVWRTVARLGVPPEQVEDVVQETFLTAHRKRAIFDSRSSAETYLLGVAIKLSANARRNSKRRALVVLPDSLPDGASAPDEALERRRKLAALDRTLSTLPDEQREVVVLCDLEQFSAPIVAQLLNMKLNTVYSRLRLGRAALTRHLVESELP